MHENESALAKIHYQFVHVNDTTQRDKNHHDEMVLYLGQRSSFYTSYANQRIREQLKEQINAPGFDGSLVITGSGSGTPESYYTVPSKKLLQQVYSIMGDYYLTEEKFPALDWKVGQETREIGGYSCQKAETHFKGRDYIAWFTTTIPFHAGPWKLQGLPGLILEAADTKGEVSFTYAGFDKMEDPDVRVGIPEGSIKTKKKDLQKLVDAFHKNPRAAVKVHSVRGGSARDPFKDLIDPSEIKSISVKKQGTQKSPITNNPIELEE